MPRHTAKPYFYAGTQCLINHLGIRDADELDHVQKLTSALLWPSALARVRHKRAQQEMVGKGNSEWKLSHLLLAHSTLFGKIYPFAGKKRTVDIKKSTAFTPHEEIETQAGKVFRNLNISLAALKKIEGPEERKEFFANAIADFYGGINNIHVFREGNGRAQLIVCTAMATEAGFDLVWDRMRSPGKKYLFDCACINWKPGENRDLRRQFELVISVSESKKEEAPIHNRRRLHIRSFSGASPYAAPEHKA